MKNIQCIVLGVLLWGAASAAQAQLDPAPEEGSIIGTLIDQETGAPAQYCRIMLHSIALENTNAPSLIIENGSIIVIPAMYHRSTYSDSQGAFSFTNLSAGYYNYELEIQSPIYQQQTVSGSFSAGTNDWGTIEVSERPFYVQRFLPVSIISATAAPITIDPSVVRTTVVNTTGKGAYMRFWLTGKLERRDNSEYYGCSTEALLKIKKPNRSGYKKYATYYLVPGENEIELKVKEYGPDMVVSQIMINGGRSYMEPLLVPQSVGRFSSAFPLIYYPSYQSSTLTMVSGNLTVGSSSSGTIYIDSGSSGTANFTSNSANFITVAGSSNTLNLSSSFELARLNFSMASQLFGPTNTIIQSGSETVAP